MPIQLIDIAEGLSYMHKLPVVHGDLKGVGNYRIRLNYS